jgi:hypothetical protein
MSPVLWVIICSALLGLLVLAAKPLIFWLLDLARWWLNEHRARR